MLRLLAQYQALRGAGLEHRNLQLNEQENCVASEWLILLLFVGSLLSPKASGVPAPVSLWWTFGSRLDSESNTRVPATLKPGRTEFTTNTCDSSPPRDSRGNWVAAVCRRQSCKRQFCVMMKNTVWSGVTLSWIWILAPQLHTYMIRQSSLIFLGSKMEMARGSQIVGRIKWDNVCTEQKHDQ